MARCPARGNVSWESLHGRLEAGWADAPSGPQWLGFVVRNDDNIIIASASGLPPEWIDDIPGTEAWALAQVAMHAELGCTFFVECKPCVDAFHDGPKACQTDN